MSQLAESSRAHEAEGDVNRPWQPHIIALACNWCTYAGADMAGTLRLTYPPNVHIVRLPCTGQMNAMYVLKAFEQGADGVIVSGCHPGDCHYVRGNLLARRRAALLRRLLHLLGLDPRRLHFAWVSASQGAKWAELVGDVVEEVRRAGPIAGWANRDRVGFDTSDVCAMLSLPEPGEPPRDRPSTRTNGRVTHHLRNLARELLKSGDVSQVIGYQHSNGRTIPAIMAHPEHADVLVWDESCQPNLTTYLTRIRALHGAEHADSGDAAPAGTVHLSIEGKGIRPPKEACAPGAVAVVVKPCDAKSIVALEQEGQINRRRVSLIGVPCEGMWEGDRLAAKCYACPGGVTELADWAVTAEGAERAGETNAETSERFPLPTAVDPRLAQLEALWQADPAERWAFWQEQFRLCLRCDACRAVCPLCYCESCITDKHRPQWISRAADAVGNTAWNFIRAFHLAGRCVGCDACARACPAEIHLELINFALAREIEDRFGYRAGEDPRAAPPLTTFKPDDPQEFIR